MGFPSSKNYRQTGMRAENVCKAHASADPLTTLADRRLGSKREKMSAGEKVNHGKELISGTRQNDNSFQEKTHETSYREISRKHANSTYLGKQENGYFDANGATCSYNELSDEGYEDYETEPGEKKCEEYEGDNAGKDDSKRESNDGVSKADGGDESDTDVSVKEHDDADDEDEYGDDENLHHADYFNIESSVDFEDTEDDYCTEAEEASDDGDVEDRTAASENEDDINETGGKKKVNANGDVLCNEDSDTGIENEQNQPASDIWSKEVQHYLEQPVHLHAKLEYRVRTVLSLPGFQASGRTISSFANFYEEKFGVSFEDSGFSSPMGFCQALPHIVQRASLDAEGKIYLVESSRNIRASAGITSGLRRHVYDVLSLHQDGISLPEFEEAFQRRVGKSLAKVLTEHAYDSPTIEDMVRDMSDLAVLKHKGNTVKVALCKGAEDPTLTDGILLGRAIEEKSMMNVISKGNESRRLSSFQDSNTLLHLDSCFTRAGFEASNMSSKSSNKDAGLFDQTVCEDSSTIEETPVQSDELDDIEHITSDASFSYENEYLQSRLRLRMLLAYYNAGRGLHLSELADAYQSMFFMKLDIQKLGFTRVEELAKCWPDIFSLNSSTDYAYIRCTKENKRIINTLKTGLRATIFSVFVTCYPEGLAIYDFLHSLQKSLLGKLWETLQANGYETSLTPEMKSLICKNKIEFQLVDFPELFLLLHDVSDFVRHGCDEDGSPVVRLRDGGFPVLDLPDFELDNGNEVKESDNDPEKSSKVRNGCDGADDTKNECFTNMESVEFGTSGRNRITLNSVPSTSVPHGLRHQVRLILGSPMYIESGVPLLEFPSIYKERTGHILIFGQNQDLKSLLFSIPDVVSRSCLGGNIAKLAGTSRNRRVVSITKSGLRQVLYWALLKNPGGVWAHFLEGWYADFSGQSLTLTLCKHGYRMCKNSWYVPVQLFLKDSRDILCRHHTTNGIYMLMDDADDPVSADARLLGLSPVDIQYDPLRDHFGSMEAGGLSHSIKPDIQDCALEVSGIWEKNKLHADCISDCQQSSTCGCRERGETAMNWRTEAVTNGGWRDCICNKNDSEGSETRKGWSRLKPRVSKSVFESESEVESRCQQEAAHETGEGEHYFLSECEQSTGSEEEYRRFCVRTAGRARVIVRNRE